VKRIGRLSQWAGALAGSALLAGVIVASASASASDRDDSLTSGRASYERADSTYIADTFCLPDLSAQSLSKMFDNEPGGIIGADYPRTVETGDGNVLWTFQDARVRTPDGGARYVHNIGLLQIGACFNVLVGGSTTYPEAWLFPHHTSPEQRWFWPLDAEVGADGAVYIFAVEMYERGENYLEFAEPGETFVARFNPDDWNIEWYGQPADTSSDLYGWSIETDDDWTYLFAQCHRQFGYDSVLGVPAHDRSCSDRVTLARVPVGRLFDTPEYWTGDAWSRSKSNAEPIIERSGRFANPTQFVLKNGRWLALTKIDDWFGSEIVIESAIHPIGPYFEVERRTAARKCVAECNTYFSSWIDAQNLGRPNDPLIISLSHNRWDGLPSHVYRPTYDIVLPPPDQPTVAMRCILNYCS
jgi:hypothetical protein